MISKNNNYQKGGFDYILIAGQNFFDQRDFQIAFDFLLQTFGSLKEFLNVDLFVGLDSHILDRQVWLLDDVLVDLDPEGLHVLNQFT